MGLKLKDALVALELAFSGWLLLFVLKGYFSKTPIPKEEFIAFILFPCSILATVIMFSYYISIKFGKSIAAYGLVLGLAISLAVFAVRLMPPLLTLGLALYLLNRFMVLTEAKEIRQLKAEFLADHLVSFQIAALILLVIAKDYVEIFESSRVSPILLAVVIIWYLFTIFYNAKELMAAYRKWSRSEF